VLEAFYNIRGIADELLNSGLESIVQAQVGHCGDVFRPLLTPNSIDKLNALHTPPFSPTNALRNQD
jgi:hypothetical protein